MLHLNVFSSFAVSKLPEARSFYTEVLELEVIYSTMGLLELKLSAAQNVLIYPKPDHQPATFTILNIVVPDIKEAVSALQTKGIAMLQYDLPQIRTDAMGIAWGDPSVAWFNDPSGNIIALIQDHK